MKTNSEKSFLYSTIEITIVFLIIVLSKVLNTSADLGSLAIGVLVFSSGIIGVLGFVKAIKSFKEPNNFKKVFGILVNSFVVLFFLFVIGSNVSDIIKVLG